MTNEHLTQIETIIAKDAIRELVQTYCNACDRGDLELLKSLYLEDAADDHGVNPSGTVKEFLDMVPEMLSSIHVIQHNITNHSIRVRGDEAEGEAYALDYHSFEGADGPTLLVLGGRYLDRYRRRE